ncbi:hypothetical protein [Methylomonas sp. AM2-LC]|uniref:hypothetical protein n=1 Tax=Methylomonas sp. AM2-LC TaxID=3153301 RepID=UPI003263D866
MSSRLVYGILAICSTAMLLFVAGFIVFQLHLSLLTTLFYSVAAKLLLLAFALLLLSGMLVLITALGREVRSYFRHEASALRRVLAMQTQTQQLAQLNYFKNRQLSYFSQFKRQKLLAADDKKQLRHLYLAIHQELQSVKHNIPHSHYQNMYKALRQYHQQADAKAMLSLREQIPCP